MGDPRPILPTFGRLALGPRRQFRAAACCVRSQQSQDRAYSAGAARRTVPARGGCNARPDRTRPSRRLDRRFHDRRRARRYDPCRTRATACARRAAGSDHARAQPARRLCAVAHLAPAHGLAPDVLHGHGAKGAALARLTPAAPNAIRAYTPHGGSLVYCPGTLSGGFYRSIERILNPRTDLFLFESSYIAELYRRVVAPPRGMVRVVRNGIAEAEFEPAVARTDATDIVCVGELRPVKAIDVLIDALGHPAAIRPPRQRDHRWRRARRREAAGAGNPDRTGRSNPLYRPLSGAHRLYHGTHAGHPVARRIACLMWCWKPPRPDFRSSLPMSAEFRRFSVRKRIGSFHPTTSAHSLPQSRPRWTIRTGCVRPRRCSKRGCAASSRCTRWSNPTLRPIAKRSQREKLLNSHNQFLKIVHYVAGK